MSTSIKKLKQNGLEFVPISLAEAIVVNTTNIANLKSLGITTLDKVLNALSLIDSSQQDAINKINLTLQNFNIGLSYKVVNKLPTASADCSGIIYLVKTSTVNQNQYSEYICIETNLTYAWEMLGTVSTDIDLSGYVTIDDFNKLAQTVLEAEDVVDSLGNKISVTYNIPSTLYDTNN